MGILRLVLALTVVVGHNQFAREWWGPGVYMAVKAFFIISGFYMALILSGKYESVGSFYLSRALRLYPIYLVILVLSYAAAQMTGGALNPFVDINRWGLLNGTPELLLKIANVIIVGLDLTTLGCVEGDVFHPYLNGCPGVYLNNFVLVPQAWSIGIELVFYAIAPFVIRIRNVVLGLLIAAGLLLRLVMDFTDLNVNPWHRSVAPFEMVYFLIGVAAFRIYKAGWLRHPLFGLSLLCVTPFYWMIEQQAKLSPFHENWTWWLYFLAVAIGLPSLFAMTKNWKWDREIGELSYPVYICHILVMAAIDRYLGHAVYESLGNMGWQILNVAAILAMSCLLNLAIGKPLDRIRYRLTTKATNSLVPYPAIGAAHSQEKS